MEIVNFTGRILFAAFLGYLNLVVLWLPMIIKAINLLIMITFLVIINIKLSQRGFPDITTGQRWQTKFTEHHLKENTLY